MASRLTSSRTRGRRLSEGATSTGTPSISESSLRKASSVNSPVPRSKSTRKSTSLSRRSSPRAVLPKTRMLLAPWRAAHASIERRRWRSRRPRGCQGVWVENQSSVPRRGPGGVPLPVRDVRVLRPTVPCGRVWIRGPRPALARAACARPGRRAGRGTERGPPWSSPARGSIR